MWILNLFYISGWLAIAFAKVPWLLDLGRLSLGFTNGVSNYLKDNMICHFNLCFREAKARKLLLRIYPWSRHRM
ncbi:hypothetical protein HRI_003735600 [Hibiscus trionum]|uniref:Uncharacterized protein n=1 Tax=Hibiscus trionum TaxID=183268 RepID=A0A9W7ISU2_HIBTR|nr:hypothetical protein HRI_003735600 [Hibiscus trionum]